MKAEKNIMHETADVIVIRELDKRIQLLLDLYNQSLQT